ncbi:MAG: TolC family protein [Bacteroidales bacterium]|nr:TolC family protein [Bacteroidales bacterium]
MSVGTGIGMKHVMTSSWKYFLPFITISFSCILPTNAQDTLLISYNNAIRIALNESFSIQSHIKQRDAMHHYYGFYKATFKPRFDISLNTPLWQEYVNQIDRPDGLPVYNSYGSFQVGGSTKFTYVLPTGGDIGLSANLYQENLSTILDSDDEELKTQQFYSRFLLSFTQPLFTRNELKENLKEAEYLYERAVHFFTRNQMDIVYEVSKGFYLLYKSDKEVEIAVEKLQNSQESHRIATLKAESGRVAKADVLSTEVSVASDQANLLKARNNYKNIEEAFKQLIGLPAGQPIQILADLNYEVFEIDKERAIEEALKNRPEIQEKNMDINLSSIQLDRAKRVREFKAYLSAYYDLTGISTLGTGSTLDLARSSFDNLIYRPPNRGVTLTLTYPIYDWGRGRQRTLEAEIRLEEKELELENLKTTIRREVREIIRTVRESHEQMEIHKQNLDLARESYNISGLRFENGDISNQELSMERERLVNVQLTYLDAFVTYQLAVNDLKRKTLWDFANNRSYLIENNPGDGL